MQEPVIQQLCGEVAEKFGRNIESTVDVDNLQKDILETTHTDISSFTIRRLFGIIATHSKPRTSTLSAFARYLGYAGWQDWQDAHNIESGFVTRKRLKSTDLQEGDELHISWQPNRKCMLKYIGDNKYEILQAEKTKLQNGDVLIITELLIGQPLVINSVIRNRLDMGAYIAGQQTGLTEIKIKDNTNV